MVHVVAVNLDRASTQNIVGTQTSGVAVAARTTSSSRPPTRSSSWSAYSSPNLRLGAGGRAMGDSASAAPPFSLALLVFS